MRKQKLHDVSYSNLQCPFSLYSHLKQALEAIVLQATEEPEIYICICIYIWLLSQWDSQHNRSSVLQHLCFESACIDCATVSLSFCSRWSLLPIALVELFHKLPVRQMPLWSDALIFKSFCSSKMEFDIEVSDEKIQMVQWCCNNNVWTEDYMASVVTCWNSYSWYQVSATPF